MIALTDRLIITGVKGATALLAWSWQALALLALVWLGLKIFRMKSPALRHQVWLFGLTAVATLPLQSMAVQSLPSLQQARPVLNYVAEAPQTVVEFTPQSPVQISPGAPTDITAPPPPVRASAITPTIPSSLFAALFGAWLIGVLMTLALLMKNRLGLRRALRRARSVQPADLDCGASAFLMKGGVGLRLSTEIRSPVLCGVFRPIILLPADIVDWTTPAERAAMIRHEMAHVERRDQFANLIQTALSVIFFFHPMVRYACRQLSLEREIACDDHVIAAGVAAEVYAAGILKAAERSVIAVGALSAHQLALFSARQILERRLEMILNTNRARLIAHHWRYLVLPIALIAVAGFLLIPRYSAKNSSSNSPAKDSEKPAKSIPVKVTHSPQEQEVIDMIQQVAEAIPQQWQYRYYRAGLPDERLLLDDFRLYDKRNSLTIIPPRPEQVPLSAAPPNYFITKFELGAFEVSINGDSAVIDFIGTLHLSVPGQDKETLLADPYRVKLMKVNDQWQADRRNRMPWVGAMFWPPSRPIVISPEPKGAWYEAQKDILGMTIVNNGDAEFSINAQSSTTFYDSDAQKEYCCLVQNAVVKLGELELRAEKGFHMLYRDGSDPFSGGRIQLKDSFELQWGEQTYYGLGPLTANYHQPNKRLSLGSFPETRLYKTPDRSGEPITLQQLAQELKDQSLRKD